MGVKQSQPEGGPMGKEIKERSHDIYSASRSPWGTEIQEGVLIGPQLQMAIEIKEEETKPCH